MLVQGIIRVLNRAVVGLLVLIVSLYLLLWTLNWQDEAPSPESLQLQQILDAQQILPTAENGYQYYQQHHAKALILPDALRALLRCKPEQCLVELKAARTELPEWLAQQQLSLNAYQTLLGYPVWQYPLPQHNTEFPPMSPLLEMQQLFLIDIWLKVQMGDLAKATAMLQQDLIFWRQQLRSANSLLSKSIAVSRVQRHFDFAAIVRQSVAATSYQQLIPEVWRQPFYADELSPLLAMAGEWHFSMSFVNSLQRFRPTDQNIFARWLTLDLWLPFFKPQALSNSFALISLACTEQRSAQTIVSYPWYRWFYNPLGKIFTQTGVDTCLNPLKPLTELEKARLQLIAV